MRFVENQLIHGAFLEFDFGYQCMVCFMVLIRRAVRHIERNRKSEGMRELERRFRKWSEAVMQHSYRETHPCQSQLMSAFGMIGRKQYVKRLDTIIGEMSQSLHKLKWQEMTCQNERCSVRRKDKELRKYGKCQVVRYCSRKCQKKDHASHKADCIRLVRLKEQDEREHFIFIKHFRS